MTNRVSQGQEQPSVSWSRITPTAVRQTVFGFTSKAKFQPLAASQLTWSKLGKINRCENQR